MQGKIPSPQLLPHQQLALKGIHSAVILLQFFVPLFFLILLSFPVQAHAQRTTARQPRRSAPRRDSFTLDLSSISKLHMLCRRMPHLTAACVPSSTHAMVGKQHAMHPTTAGCPLVDTSPWHLAAAASPRAPSTTTVTSSWSQHGNSDCAGQSHQPTSAANRRMPSLGSSLP